jgi:hypothetical protein
MAVARGGGGGQSAAATRAGKKPRGNLSGRAWTAIRAWHDGRAARIFGNAEGRTGIGAGRRNYDRFYKGWDIEYKSDNFSNGPRTQAELDRMMRQIEKDIQNLRDGVAKPHWHFEHDPRVAKEMAPLLEKLEKAGINWTWGPNAPNL